MRSKMERPAVRLEKWQAGQHAFGRNGRGRDIDFGHRQNLFDDVTALAQDRVEDRGGGVEERDPGDGARSVPPTEV